VRVEVIDGMERVECTSRCRRYCLYMEEVMFMQRKATKVVLFLQEAVLVVITLV
jgi:hypothetical protein